MQTQYISFCKKTGLNIKSNSVKTKILTELQDNYDIKIIDKHHEVFYPEKHMHRLERVPHVCSLKSNGNPYFMYLTKIDFIDTIVMIDKKIQMGYALPRMIIIRLFIKNEKLFENTLIEGEMVHDKNDQWLFLMSDLLVYCNTSLKVNNDIFKRINTLYTLLDNDFCPRFMDLFSVQVKRYVSLKDIQWLYTDFIKTLPYTTRGVYIKPLYCKFRDILLNFDNSLIKKNVREKFATNTHFLTSKTDIINNDTQPSSTNTMNNDVTIYIDIEDKKNDDNELKQFNIQKTDTPDFYKLYDIDFDTLQGNACVDSIKTSKMLSNTFKDKSLLNKVKFMCKKTNNTNFNNIWIPMSSLSV